MTPPQSSRQQNPEDVDAFLATVLRLVQWMQENSRVVAFAAVVAALTVAAGLYYQNYREDVRQQAASQLQQLQGQLQAQAPPDTLARSVQNFVDRYGDTRYGDEARLLMARIQLSNGQWEQAASTLESVVGEYPADSPTGYAARKLLAAAQESAGNPEQALQLYGELADGAQFAFQRNEAAAARARLLASRGDLSRAQEIYSRLVEEADTTDAGVASEDLQTYRMRLGEIQARLAAGDGAEEEPAADSAGAPMGG